MINNHSLWYEAGKTNIENSYWYFPFREDHKLLVFVRQFDEDNLIILGLVGESVPLGAEMACEANLRSEGSDAMWTGDGGCCRRLRGSAFSVLSALLSCSNPVGFMGLFATANRCPSLWIFDELQPNWLGMAGRWIVTCGNSAHRYPKNTKWYYETP